MNLRTNKIIEKAKKDGWEISLYISYSDERMRNLKMWNPNGKLVFDSYVQYFDLANIIENHYNAFVKYDYDKRKLDGSYSPPSSPIPPPRPSPHHKLDKQQTMKSKNIKDCKINTRILYCHKRHQTPQFEAIISEFSDSGEYVCLEYSPNKTKDWYKVADIIVLDTLKNKQTPVDEVSYEQQEADAIEEECNKMTEEDWNSFGEYHNKPEPKEKEDVKPNTLEIYPPDSEKGKSVYFLEIYNGERWKLCLRNRIDNFSVPKIGWFGEGHPYTLGEGKIASEGLINMYTLSNLKRIVDGLNMLDNTDRSSLPSTTFETSKEKVDWQKDFPHSITTSP